MPTALVTGATSGIGLEIAHELARLGFDLVLVARRGERLREVAGLLESATIGRELQVTTVPIDLADPGAPQALFEVLRETPIDFLVNNAGVGDFGPLARCDGQALRGLLQVDVVAPTHLCHLFLPGMLARGQGRVMNVASISAYFPGPTMAVYFAAKAYLLSFSEALAVECEGTGVSVTCLCPGPTATEFTRNMTFSGSPMKEGPAMPARSVAQCGVNGAMRGQRVVIPGRINRAMVILPRIFSSRKMAEIMLRLSATDAAGSGSTQASGVQPGGTSEPPGRPLALVTGSSSGIPLEFARELARQGYDLTLVVGPTADLRALAGNFGQAKVEFIAVELWDPNAPAVIRGALDQGFGERPIDVLVHGTVSLGVARFVDLDTRKMLEMVRVNIVAPALLAREFLPGMLRRGKGCLVTSNSAAGFSPGPFTAVYSASSAFSVSFCEALACETRLGGVHVSCLLPRLAGSGLVPDGTEPAVLARYGLQAALRGEVLAVPDSKTRLERFFTRFLSRRFTAERARRLSARHLEPKRSL